MRYILIIVTIFYYFHLNGQIKLLKCSFGACNHGYSDEEYKSCPKFTKVDFIDPTLTLELKNFSNCVGIYNPKVVVYGPIINLRFDEFKLDSINTFNEKKEPTSISAECFCCFETKWDLQGIDTTKNYIFLVQGNFIQNQDLSLLDSYLFAYELEGKRLINVIDKNKNKQGQHEINREGKRELEFYIDGKLQ